MWYLTKSDLHQRIRDDPCDDAINTSWKRRGNIPRNLHGERRYYKSRSYCPGETLWRSSQLQAYTWWWIKRIGRSNLFKFYPCWIGAWFRGSQDWEFSLCCYVSNWSTGSPFHWGIPCHLCIGARLVHVEVLWGNDILLHCWLSSSAWWPLGATCSGTWRGSRADRFLVWRAWPSTPIAMRPRGKVGAARTDLWSAAELRWMVWPFTTCRVELNKLCPADLVTWPVFCANVRLSMTNMVTCTNGRTQQCWLLLAEVKILVVINSAIFGFTSTF